MIEQTPTIEPQAQPQAPVTNPPTEAAQPAPAAQPASGAMRRSPFLASVLSILPGLGQVYLGYYQLGFINAIVIATLLTLLATGDLGPLIPLASVFMAFYWLYNIVDAGRRATMINEALAGRGTMELPEDYAAPGLRGSFFGGAVLVIIGIVLLSRTMFGVSLEWTEEWWPVAIVVFGGYLIYKAKSDSAAADAEKTDEN